MQTKNRSIKSNAVLNTIKTILSLLFPLVTFPYVSRVLPVESLGMYNFSSSVVSYFILLAGLGISNYAIREGTQYRNNKQEIGLFASEIFSINFFATILSYVLLFFCLVLCPNIQVYTKAICILSIQMIFTTFGVNWLCNIYEDFFYITVRTILIQLISLICIFLFVKDADDIYVYIGIIAFTASIPNIMNLLYVRKKYCIFSLRLKCNLKKHLKPILILFAASITISIYMNSDITMLGFMKDDYQVGLYSASARIYSIVKNILVSVLVVLVPSFSLCIKDASKHAKAEDLFAQAFNVLFILVMPAGIGQFMLSEEIICLISGEEYIQAATSLKILAIASLFSLFSHLFSHCVLIPANLEKKLLGATCISAIVNVGLNFVFIPAWGINGAAITTVISEAVVCFITYFYSRPVLKVNFKFKNIISVVIGCTGIVVICCSVRGIIDGLYARLAVAIPISIIIYFAILVVCKNKIVINMLRNRVKR